MLSAYSDRSITGLDHIVIFADARSAPSYEFLEISFNLAPDAHFCDDPFKKRISSGQVRYRSRAGLLRGEAL